MSVQNVEAFYKHALKNPALVQSLQGLPDAETFERTAVDLGKCAGFQFSAEEARGWITAQLAKEADGELSDDELEAVAGGKGAPLRANFNMPGMGGNLTAVAPLTTVAPMRGWGG